jgi:hypothetical protein
LKNFKARGTYKHYELEATNTHTSNILIDPHHIGLRTYHVDHAGAAIGSALDILNGVAKLAEGPSLLKPWSL